MTLALAVLCFFAAAVFVGMAFTDRYSNDKGAQFLKLAHPPWVFKVRIVIAGVLVFVGVLLL